jgi:hypothetical protein
MFFMNEKDYTQVEAYKTLYVTILAMKKRDTIMLWPKNAKRKSAKRR